MWVHELIGRKITNIYDVLEYESYGLDRGECFIEIDNNLIIDIPYDYYEPHLLEVTIRELPPQAESLFENLSDLLFYHLKDGKRVIEITKKVTYIKVGFWQRVKNLLVRGELPVSKKEIVEEIQSYKADRVENKCKYIKDRVIADVLFFNDYEKSCIELDNGYIITETSAAMNGTGLVGLNIYDNLAMLKKRRGNDFLRVSSAQL
ncbi:hypothetical protein A3860_21040 [Niastella vici]|uniref:Uncharacterized protein n=1 Tax=Niastella vici TaxID=1703345 RepID=A0A1V9G1W3_9BACT|nr:hypothetical protein [Niastella vici]OQP64456.1 hypothetical protein A3860_21040 [Niastella vici]